MTAKRPSAVTEERFTLDALASNRAMSIDRRGFLVATLTAAGSFMLARHTIAAGAATISETASPASTLGLFVRIEADGTVVIGARGCEIGQGVLTSLPMLIAEELDVPWAWVRVEQLPHIYEVGPEGPRSRYGAQGAGGSTSIPDSYQELRQIGAVARRMLVEAAAARWNADAAVLRTEAGQVMHADGRRLAYAALAAEAAKRTPLKAMPTLKDAKQFTVIGKPARVADARKIVTGAPLYGLDQSIAGALVAVMLRAPELGAAIDTVDDAAALAIPGVRGVYRIDGPAPSEPFSANLAAGVAVVADDTWAAIQGRKALKVTWKEGPFHKESMVGLRTQAERALAAAEAGIVHREGDVATAMKAAARSVEARYELPFLSHATLEPMNATVRIDKDRALLIAPIQSPGGASRMVHALTGIARENIEIRLVRAGGGFGRRGQNDYIAEAVKIAKAAGKPIKLIWTREDDIQNGFYRPFGVHHLKASIDADSRISGWHHRVAATSRVTRDAGFPPDADLWIGCHEKDEFPAHLVPAWSHEFANIDSGTARGWWRAPLPTFIAFPVQCFTDEVAHALGKDPLAFRLELLGAPRTIEYRGHGGPGYHTGRLANVLKLAAEAIGWGRKTSKGRGLGIAAHFVFGGYAAHAMEVSVARDGSVKIHRCVCAVDVGQPVNPLGIEAQMIGGTLDGISTALGLAITIENGRIVQSNFHDYPLLRMKDAPDVEVIIVPSTENPSGAGEMGIPTAAPALVNAIYAATGKRIRDLPIAKQLA